MMGLKPHATDTGNNNNECWHANKLALEVLMLNTCNVCHVTVSD